MKKLYVGREFYITELATIKNRLADTTALERSLSQAGLFYGHDEFDKERYQRIRDISAEMMAERTGLPLNKVKGLFCGETGYQTPKVDTRAAIFDHDKILLVRERSGRWSMPGGLQTSMGGVQVTPMSISGELPHIPAGTMNMWKVPGLNFFRC